ncbi:MAG: site-specific integrase [Clostridiales bacterium]|nr:site-specific integrase [Clostridiales bacterium]
MITHDTVASGACELQTEGLTISRYLERWLETAIRGNVQPTTYGIYRGHINKHIVPVIGELLLSELRKEQLQRFAADMLTGGLLSGGSVRAIMKMLRAALEEAVSWGYIGRNPCAGLKLPKEERSEASAFTRNEQERLEAAIANSDDDRDIGVLLMLYTGLRLGEAVGLKWEYIDFDKKQLRIVSCIKRIPNLDKTYSKTIIKEVRPKTTNSKRAVFIPDFLFALLAEKRGKSNSAYVLSMPDGRFIEPRTMQFIYKRLLEKAGVPYRKLHSTRHSYAVRALEEGISVKTVSENLGHATAAVTLTFYAHSLEEHKLDAAARMNGLYINKNRPVF